MWQQQRWPVGVTVEMAVSLPPNLFLHSLVCPPLTHMMAVEIFNSDAVHTLHSPVSEEITLTNPFTFNENV